MSSTSLPVANPRHRPIAWWLLTCCALVFAMVVLGGVTRLTGSGLSMVEWEPIVGTIPPLSSTQWQETYHKYQQTPEYRKKNLGMSLEEFKGIFWFEYAHRLLGRSIGMVFLLPFLYFLFMGRIEKPMVPKLITMFLLGGLQGALGWYMVASGLIDNPHVSQYRLTAHLAAAFLIYAYMFWVALGLLYPQREASAELRPLWRFAHLVAGLIALTVLSGGFVAGLKAGFAYNTFPLMDGHWLPPAYGLLEPAWKNIFENIPAVQFNHRLLALSSLALVIILWSKSHRYVLPSRARLGLNLLLAMTLAQVTLGISTLLLLVPIPLASAHQAGALVLFTLTLYTLHALRLR
jgi:cytochrome c oxidase assembly protein subunit 15